MFNERPGDSCSQDQGAISLESFRRASKLLLPMRSVLSVSLLFWSLPNVTAAVVEALEDVAACLPHVATQNTVNVVNKEFRLQRVVSSTRGVAAQQLTARKHFPVVLERLKRLLREFECAINSS